MTGSLLNLPLRLKAYAREDFFPFQEDANIRPLPFKRINFRMSLFGIYYQLVVS